jgi:ectoine hydroxylase-related dioxygenase (phytanoyl-CoA dioxygenase family)
MKAKITDDGIISEEQKAQYREEGYMILERIVPEDMLCMLREECSYFLGYADAELDAAGITTDGLNHRALRYFIANRYRMSPFLHQFIFSPIMAEVARTALGPDVYLFNEQWVVKGAEQGMKFAWHQDSGYVKTGDPETAHPPYLTCWIPLDDVNEENGTVYLLPHSRGGTSHTIFDHEREEKSNDLVGYTGDDPGIPIEVPAGSVVAFTSYNFHRSGANTSPNMRRVYLPQYSSAPIMRSDGSRLWGMAVPFVKDGKLVYDRNGDAAEKYGGGAGIP